MKFFKIIIISQMINNFKKFHYFKPIELIKLKNKDLKNLPLCVLIHGRLLIYIFFIRLFFKYDRFENPCCFAISTFSKD